MFIKVIDPQRGYITQDFRAKTPEELKEALKTLEELQKKMMASDERFDELEKKLAETDA